MMTVMMMMIILEDGLLYHQTPYRINSFFKLWSIFLWIIHHIYMHQYWTFFAFCVEDWDVILYYFLDHLILARWYVQHYYCIYEFFVGFFLSNYVFNKPLYIALYTLYIIHTHTSKCGINAIPILELNHEWDLQMTVYCTGILFWRKETQGKIYTYKTTGKISKVQLALFISIHSSFKVWGPKMKMKGGCY